MVRGRLRSQHFWSWRGNERTADMAVSFMRDFFCWHDPMFPTYVLMSIFLLFMTRSFTKIFYESLGESYFTWKKGEKHLSVGAVSLMLIWTLL